MNGKSRKKRKYDIILSLILAAILIVYMYKVADFQVVNSETYVKQAGGTYSRTAVIKAARGEILDRYGRQLAVNRNGFDIVFNRAYLSDDDINDTVIKLIDVMTEYGVAWNDNLPITTYIPYDYTDSGTAKKTLQRTIGVAHYATAADCASQLITRYGLQSLTPEMQRKLMGIRYTMEIADFSIRNPYTFASDIPENLMLKISESAFMIDGVTINTVPVREYVDPTLAVNIIGTVGSISAERWEELKDKGYSYSDKIGISGIEAVYEEYLHGTDGEITYTLNSEGNIIKSEITKEPVPGNTIIMSLDKNLQRNTQNSLEQLIKELVSKGGTATGGAAVAIDIKTGQVLLAATYPTFNINDYFTKYNELSSAKNSPLTNRAFNAIYPPGSSIKPVIGIAALETGALSPNETIRCVHTYMYYAPSYTPSCMGHHGNIGIVTALSKSCNYFFFELGRRMGIDTVNKYLASYGFGDKTGVEVTESSGLLSTSEKGWFAGDTLQVSIGQHNAFTPIQICSATSTVANGGTLYKTTLLNKIVSYDLADTIVNNEPVIKNQIKVKDSVLNIVKEGMLSVTEDGTGSSVFKNYPIKIGGKTGTSQVDNAADNNVFVAFAPYDNPEIAVSVVLEHGASSYTSGSVMKEIMNAYFFNQEVTYSETAVNTPLQ